MPVVEYGARFKKTLTKKTPDMQGAIMETMKRLADNPRHPGLHTSKVQGVDGVFEAYIDDANRLTFEWHKGAIWLRNNCNHGMTRRSP